MPNHNSIPDILSCQSGASIAYHRLDGKSPGVIFMTGFMSDMDGGKALALEDYCRGRGQAFLRFDYQGHGQSSGDFADGHIGVWAEDAVSVLDELTEGPQILVGSSMGGWIMLLTAMRRTERIAGLIGIAAAPDFTETLLPNELGPEQLAEIEDKGMIVLPSEYEDDYVISKTLLAGSRDSLIMNRPIPVTCPVRLLHGIGDVSVPWRTALDIQDRLQSNDVEVTLIKNGDHRLSEEADLERLMRMVESLLVD